MSASNSNLFLILKGQWYDMIEAGIKKEEYREIKPYWNKRLPGRGYQTVTFQLGYKSKKRMTFDIRSIEIGKGYSEWGAIENKKYFVISLGKRIN